MRALVAIVVAVLSVACAPGDEPPVDELRVDELLVESGGVVLNVRIVGQAVSNAGEGSAALITVHGGPGLTLQSMAPFEALARPARQVVGYDQRGSGRSTQPVDGRYGLVSQVADLEAIRVELGVETVHVLGQSWGGAVAAAYAAEYPDRVSSLVLVGAIPLDRDEFRSGQRRFQERVAELQAIGLVPDPVPVGDAQSCLPAFEAVLPVYLVDPASGDDVVVGPCSAPTSRATYDAFINDDVVDELAARLGGYAGPALVVMGEHDAFGLEWLQRIEGLLSGAEVEAVVVPAAGHLVMAEQREELLAVIEEFLDELLTV